jgi:LVIVD repeat
MCTPRGLYVIDVGGDGNKPRIVGELTNGFLRNPRCIAVQFRYGFITDDDGLKILDLTEPTRPVPLPRATVHLNHAGRLYVARTYAYVANGPEGLAIIDVENPEHPFVDQIFNAGGALNDTRAVQIGSVNASQFALVADGKNGLRVVQLISPDTVPGAQGFSPRPNPRLIATYHTKGEAICISRGLERDRVVDETGGQTVVFGRRGARPFHVDEMERFYRRSTSTEGKNVAGKGDLYFVEDVAVSGGVLATKGGQVLTPLATPAPSPQPMISPAQPEVEPTAIPTPR